MPISAVVKDIKIVNKHAAVVRKNLNNTVTVFAGVQEGFNPNEIIVKVKDMLAKFDKTSDGLAFIKEGYQYKFTGQMEDQQKELSFLSTALLIAVFNSIDTGNKFNAFSSPVIILSSVVLSFWCVFRHCYF